MFLQDRPIGPGDRVLAGLSVAFDASCEEMWLAWRSRGVPRAGAPRRSSAPAWTSVRGCVAQRRHRRLDGADARGAVAGRGARAGAAADLRRGGLPARARPSGSSRPGREVWNTYGPTEATVVACGARARRRRPRCRIGLPLDGWDLAVVGAGRRSRSASGEAGELIIGGVGLARYLDPAKDAEKYAPMPTLGWDRAYRSGDLVALRRRRARLRRAGPTTRSRSAAAGSSSARSTRPCWRCPASRARPPPCGRRRPAASSSSATSSPSRRTLRPAPRRWPGCARTLPAGPRARPRGRRRRCPRARPARSTATRCRGRCPGPPTTTSRATSPAPPPGSPHSGRPCSARPCAPSAPTSSTTAAAACPRRSSSRGCASASRGHRRRRLRPPPARRAGRAARHDADPPTRPVDRSVRRTRRRTQLVQVARRRRAPHGRGAALARLGWRP